MMAGYPARQSRAQIEAQADRLEASRQALRGGDLAWVPVLVAWLLTTGYVLARLPRLPVATLDSTSYLALGPTRAPGYGWFLHAVQALGGPDLAYLPLAQTLLIALALLGFGLALARLLRSGVAAAVVVLVWAHTGTFEASRYVMSEGLFLPAMLAGLACCLVYARRGGWAALLGATIAFGLALLTRMAGAVLLLLPLLLVLLDGRLGPGAVLRRWALVLGVSAALVLGGMAANQARNGVFEIGSNTGTSLLGKALLLLRPETVQAVGPGIGQGIGQNEVLRRVLPPAAEARAAVAAAPGYAASLRAQDQAYEELRWWSFFPAAGGRVAQADSREAAQLAGQVARAVIATDPMGYLRLVLRDWSGLVLYPHFWPVAASPAGSPHPFFAHCPDDPGRCWTFFRLEVPRYYGMAMLGTSLFGIAAGLVLVVGWGGRALRRRLGPAERAMLAMALVAQASLVATALFEAGLWRYTIAAHAMNAALICWAMARLIYGREKQG